MKLPADILDRLPEDAVRRIALAFLTDIELAAPRLLDESDAEALHDFRVGVRRLRSALKAWRDHLAGSARKKERRVLRDLQSETGASRDLEVALLWVESILDGASSAERPGIEWIRERLRVGYEAGMRGVRAGVLAHFEREGPRLRRRLERCCLPLEQLRGGSRFAEVLDCNIHEHAAELFAHLAAIGSAADRTEMHAARIRGKRLRYLLEPLRGVLDGASEVVRGCKKLQDVLGDLNDVHVQRAYLREAQGEAAGGAEAGLLRPGLLALQDAVERREALLFSKLRQSWLEDDAAELRSEVALTTAACESVGGQDWEIERKYLLRAAPAEMPEGRVVKIEQGWLPGQRLRERLRRITENGEVSYRRTIKLGRGVERFELEEETTAAVFDVLWPLTEGCRVRKRRTIVREGKHVWEVDCFLDREGMHLAEVELRSAKEAVSFPHWLAPLIVREVSEEQGFTNLELAR